MRSIASIIIMASFLICFFSCGTKETQDAVSSEKQKIPINEILYTIINEEKMGNIKTSIDVRLESEVNKETITKIANELRKDGRRNYQRVFINYYLPGMEVGSGAWALSHYNPELEVEILGLTKDEKTRLLEKTSQPDSNVIGRWIDQTPYMGGVITISRNANILKLSIKYKDGSSTKKKLIEKIVNGQKRWIEEDNVFGEYYVLNNDGNLSIYDTEGLIKTLLKTK